MYEDPLDEFLSRLLSDTSDLISSPHVAATASSSAFASSSVQGTTSATTSTFSTPSSSTAAAVVPTGSTIITPYYTPPTSAHLTCQWLSRPDLPVVCGTPLPTDAKDAVSHFRQVHQIRGNEKTMVQCHWRDCHVVPMQRGSLVRHVLTVHLGLLRWRCEVCGRSFSRKGTAHVCAEDE